MSLPFIIHWSRVADAALAFAVVGTLLYGVVFGLWWLVARTVSLVRLGWWWLRWGRP